MNTRDSILRAAAELFYEKGFDGASQREIAGRVGIDAGSIYNHFPSKQDILATILISVGDDLRTELIERTSCLENPVDKLIAACRLHVLASIDRREESACYHTEMRVLQGDKRELLLANRGKHQGIVESIIREGVGSGVFETEDIELATIAILTMWNSVISWYKPDGRLSPEEIADRYCDMALAILGHPRRGGNNAIKAGS